MKHISSLRYVTMDLEWTRSHPEKRNEAWTNRDYGIYLADLAASGKAVTRDLLKGATDVLLSARDMVQSEWGLQRFGGWYWERGGEVMRESIGSLFAEKRTENYLKERDRYREEAGRDPEWEGATVEFAASIRGQKEGLGSWARWNRIIFDKVWDGRNEGKGTGVVYECPLCGEEDGMEHWVGGCEDAGVRCQRSKVLVGVGDLLSRLCLGAASVFINFVEALRQVFLEHPLRHRMWCGLWLPPQVDHLRPVYDLMNGPMKLSARSVLRKVGRLLQDGVLEIWSERVRRVKNVGGVGDEDGIHVVLDEMGDMRNAMMRWLIRDGDGVDWG
jgi:hypothetical protein